MLRRYVTSVDYRIPASLAGLIAATVFVFLLVLYPASGQAESLNDIVDRVDVEFDPIKKGWKKRKYRATVVVTNTSASEIAGPIRIAITAFKNTRHYLKSADGVTDEGYPYFDIDLPNGALGVGEATEPFEVVFGKMSKKTFKKWRKANKNTPITDPNGPGWSEHDFPIKFTYAVAGNPIPLEILISELDAFPGAVRINSGRVPVRFTTSILTRVNFPINQVVLQTGIPLNRLTTNLASGNFAPNAVNVCGVDDVCQIPLNDDGINGDLEANDGIYSVEQIVDTDNLVHGQCTSVYASALSDAGGGVVNSDPILFCATRFVTELVDTDVADTDIIKLGEADVLGNQLLMRFDPAVPTDAFEKLLKSLRGGIVGTQLEDGYYQIAFDRVYGAEELAELIALFEQQEGVIGIDPNYVGEYTSAPSDPEYVNQHGLQLVSADDLGADEPRFIRDAGATGAGMRVVLLDSGVNAGLPDDIDPQFERDKDIDDQLGHGTEMAGIIGAPTDNETAVSSIAPDARVRSVRISKTNRITLTKMLRGFKRAKGYASRNKVVSASFSIKNMLSDGGVCRQINKVINRGAIVVVSAGNDNDNSNTGIVPGNCNSSAFDPFTDPGPVSSSNKNSLIVVGATSCTEGACNEDSRWTESGNTGSNFGGWVDIGAPGINLPTITKDGSVVTTTGTSASTALVAGAAAVLRGCEVGGPVQSTDSTLALTLDDVFNAMDLGAFTPVSGLPSRLNVYNALASVNTVPNTPALTVDSVASGTDTGSGLAFSTVTFVDDTVCDTHSIEISGGEDAGSFEIGGDLNDQLIISDGVLDISRQSSYEVEITVTDFYGAAVSQLFTIAVLD